MNKRKSNSKNTIEIIQNNIGVNSQSINSLIIHPNENSTNDMKNIMTNKVEKIQTIIQNTIVSITLYKNHNIYSSSDVNVCLSALNDIYTRTNSLYSHISDNNIDAFIDKLQNIVDKVSLIITSFGTHNIEDLLFIIFLL